MTIPAKAPPDKVSSSEDGALVGVADGMVDGAAVDGTYVGAWDGLDVGAYVGASIVLPT